MSYELRKGAEPGTWLVEIEGVTVGVLRRVYGPLSNLGKSKTKLTFQAHGSLWEASADGAPLAEDHAREIARYIKRRKTNRATAAEHLIAAYTAAGIALPEPPAAAA